MVHGIHNVIDIFEEIAEDRLNDVDFVEALSCTEGCLGGPLTVVNPFVARTNLKWQIGNAKRMVSLTKHCSRLSGFVMDKRYGV